MKILCVFFVLLFTGCAPTLSEIRTSHPVTIIKSSKSPKSLANCIYYETQLEGDKRWNPYWNKVDMTENNGIYHLTLSYSGGGLVPQNFSTAEITIKPADKGKSIIEIRNPYQKSISESISTYIEKCTSLTKPTKIQENQ